MSAFTKKNVKNNFNFRLRQLFLITCTVISLNSQNKSLSRGNFDTKNLIFFCCLSCHTQNWLPIELHFRFLITPRTQKKNSSHVGWSCVSHDLLFYHSDRSVNHATRERSKNWKSAGRDRRRQSDFNEFEVKTKRNNWKRNRNSSEKRSRRRRRNPGERTHMSRTWGLSRCMRLSVWWLGEVKSLRGSGVRPSGINRHHVRQHNLCLKYDSQIHFLANTFRLPPSALFFCCCGLVFHF